MSDHDLLHAMLLGLLFYGFVRSFRDKSDSWALTVPMLVLVLIA